jgi:hypothetical protein
MTTAPSPAPLPRRPALAIRAPAAATATAAQATAWSASMTTAPSPASLHHALALTNSAAATATAAPWSRACSASTQPARTCSTRYFALGPPLPLLHPYLYSIPSPRRPIRSSEPPARCWYQTRGPRHPDTWWNRLAIIPAASNNQSWRPPPAGCACAPSSPRPQHLHQQLHQAATAQARRQRNQRNQTPQRRQQQTAQRDHRSTAASAPSYQRQPCRCQLHSARQRQQEHRAKQGGPGRHRGASAVLAYLFTRRRKQEALLAGAPKAAGYDAEAGAAAGVCNVYEQGGGGGSFMTDAYSSTIAGASDLSSLAGASATAAGAAAHQLEGAGLHAASWLGLLGNACWRRCAVCKPASRDCLLHAARGRSMLRCTN